MRLSGRIWKDGKFWLAEVPMLDAMTQGHSEREALPHDRRPRRDHGHGWSDYPSLLPGSGSLV
jgi:hypothetical protein